MGHGGKTKPEVSVMATQVSCQSVHGLRSTNRYYLAAGGAMTLPSEVSLAQRHRAGDFLKVVAKNIHRVQQAIGNDLFKICFDSDAIVLDVKRRVRSLMDECKSSNRKPAIYYTGHGEVGTGDWCFHDGTLSFQDIGDLTPLSCKYLVIFADTCYSGHWANIARNIDEGNLHQARTL